MELPGIELGTEISFTCGNAKSVYAKVPKVRETTCGYARGVDGINNLIPTGEALPEAEVVRRELAGVPRVEVVGLSKEKVEELFWDTSTQVRAERKGPSSRCL